MANDRDELDRLLDAALACYGERDGEAGLEERILRRLAVEAAPAPRLRGVGWTIALPVAAGLLIFTIVSTTRQVHGPAPAPPQARNLQKQSARDFGGLEENRAMRRGGSRKRASGPESHGHLGSYMARLKPCPETNSGSTAAVHQPCSETKPRQRGAVLRAKSEPLPKLDIFPTPQPLSPQEQALADFAARAPKSERESLMAAQQKTAAPLHIAAIEIKPLNLPSPDVN
jgi:hypothetical protein